ncbi:DUF881 domain-containing protein [Sporichthya polymorpha]|uniref:DUF881 domain-containing protein n=1 Tax=Sporichthya polymorpha TaxID=35751 RepID=UPI0003670D0E|nr:DUF881 domain-containing protein [Sporichthya polymorpha]
MARSGWRLAVPVVLAIAGLLFAITGTTARGTNLRSGENTRLVDLIQAAQERNDRAATTGNRLRRQVERLSVQAQDPLVQQVRKEGDAIAPAAGLTPVAGAGITVTLDDAPPGAIDRAYPGLPEPTADDLVVHQQDLQAVVNALWAGGAVGIKLMDQRIISTSAVRCVGNVLILQDRVYSPPYSVTAVGDVTALSKALAESVAVSNYREYVDAYGLGWKVDRHARITVPAYSGSLDLRYAEVDEQ